MNIDTSKFYEVITVREDDKCVVTLFEPRQLDLLMEFVSALAAKGERYIARTDLVIVGG